MPSKLVSKTFVRGEVLRAKKEVFEVLESLRGVFEEWGIKSESSLEEVQVGVDEVHEAVNEVSETLDGFRQELACMMKIFDRNVDKLSIILEGSVRRIIQIKKGPNWVKGGHMLLQARILQRQNSSFALSEAIKESCCTLTPSSVPVAYIGYDSPPTAELPRSPAEK